MLISDVTLVPKITYPGCDMAGRPRAARRGAAGAVPADVAVWDVEVRCLLCLRGGDGAVGRVGASGCRSRRDEALRFREDAVPAAEFEGLLESVDGGGSAASLAEERVVLDDMRNCLNIRNGWL